MAAEKNCAGLEQQWHTGSHVECQGRSRASYRSPDGSKPGPVKFIHKQRAIYGSEWAARDQMKIQGKIHL